MRLAIWSTQSPLVDFMKQKSHYRFFAQHDYGKKRKNHAYIFLLADCASYNQIRPLNKTLHGCLVGTFYQERNKPIICTIIIVQKNGFKILDRHNSIATSLEINLNVLPLILSMYLK